MKIAISQEFRGLITPYDILRNTATLMLSVNPKMIYEEICLFEVECSHFTFSLTVSNEFVILRRGQSEVIAKYPNTIPMDKPFFIVPVWSYGKLSLFLRPKGLESYYVEYESIPISTPIELVKFARRQSLIPIEIYPNSSVFAERIYSGVVQIQQKILEADAYKSFWNIEYDGNKIVSRKPKRETEIQPLIQAMLSDHCLLANVEIIPEHHSGDGDLDFMFIGQVSDQGFCRLCAEFKLAHSSNLAHGLKVQLPKYIESRQAEYGLYCVLDFWGDEFKDSPEDVEYLLTTIDKSNNHPSVANTRIIVISLNKPITASK